VRALGVIASRGAPGAIRFSFVTLADVALCTLWYRLYRLRRRSAAKILFAVFWPPAFRGLYCFWPAFLDPPCRPRVGWTKTCDCRGC